MRTPCIRTTRTSFLFIYNHHHNKTLSSYIYIFDFVKRFFSFSLFVCNAETSKNRQLNAGYKL